MTSKVSVLDLYRLEIEEFVKTGASLRSIWNILSSKMPENAQITYNVGEELYLTMKFSPKNRAKHFHDIHIKH